MHFSREWKRLIHLFSSMEVSDPLVQNRALYVRRPASRVARTELRLVRGVELPELQLQGHLRVLVHLRRHHAHLRTGWFQ